MSFLRVRGRNEIASSLIDNIRDKLPGADTKEGTFIRDVFINPVSQKLYELYEDLILASRSQSILTAEGDALTNLASNFFIQREGMTKSSGTLRFYVQTNLNASNDLVGPSQSFFLPANTYVSTSPNNAQQVRYFYTKRIFQYFPNSATPLRSDQGVLYFDVEAESATFGENNNLDIHTINKLPDNISPFIIAVTNPISFMGGSDGEDDISLVKRIGYAITGSNIGTKDGYESFLLTNGAGEVKVVGAGDPLMFRDGGGYIVTADSDTEYIPGDGGMVDIYVLGRIFRENEAPATSNQKQESIILSGQTKISLSSSPVDKIDYLIQKSQNDLIEKSYINESDCDFEMNVTEKKYYQDVQWNFTNPTGNTNEEINLREVNKALLEVGTSAINWGEIPFLDTYIATQTNSEEGAIFDFGINEGKTYKLKAKKQISEDSTEEHYFVKKNNKIYRRKYVQPDYKLTKDTTNNYGSINSVDSIEFFTNKKPTNNTILEYSYVYNDTIQYFQNLIEPQRTLTADVLIKHPIPVKAIVLINVVPQMEYSSDETITLTTDVIRSYLESYRGMGKTLNAADIIARVRLGVPAEYIGNASIKVLTKNDSDVEVWQTKKSVKLKENEVFDIKDIYVGIITEEELLGD